MRHDYDANAVLNHNDVDPGGSHVANLLFVPTLDVDGRLDCFVDVGFRAIIESGDDVSSVVTRLMSILMLLPTSW